MKTTGCYEVHGSSDYLDRYFGPWKEHQKRMAKASKSPKVACVHCQKQTYDLGSTYYGLCLECWSTLLLYAMERAKRWLEHHYEWGEPHPDALEIALAIIKKEDAKGNLPDMLSIAFTGMTIAQHREALRLKQEAELQEARKRQEREKSQHYYQTHRAEILARRRQRYQEQRQTILERSRQYYQANRDEKIAKAKKYRKENLAKCRALARKYAKAHREEHIMRNRRWRRENREKANEYQRRYRKAHVKEMRKYALDYYYAHRDQIRIAENARRRENNRKTQQTEETP